MDSLVQAFLISRQADGCTPKTIRHHHVSLKNFTDWLDAEGMSHDPCDWDTTLLRRFVLYLQTKTTPKDKPLSGYSVTTYTQSLKTFVKWLHEEDFIEADIGARLKKPRPPQTQKQPYADDELRRMLAVSKSNHRDHAILALLIDCGLRANELCQLTMDDINLNQLLITVRLGKGRKSRVTPMSAYAAKAITKHFVKRNTDSTFLFSTAKSECITPNTLLQLVRRIAREAGVANPTVHRFRHSFALSWLRSGGDVMTLQRVMGHADLATTRVYLALTTEDLQRSHVTASPLAQLLRRSLRA